VLKNVKDVVAHRFSIRLIQSLPGANLV
jgi:hypothetical protein